MKVKKALARHNEKKKENAKKNKISSKLEYAWQVEIWDKNKFTIEQLCAKFKWFKKECRGIEKKIKCGTGLVCAMKFRPRRVFGLLI